jgi:DNA-binding NarL/FixJ family response regulator
MVTTYNLSPEVVAHTSKNEVTITSLIAGLGTASSDERIAIVKVIKTFDKSKAWLAVESLIALLEDDKAAAAAATILGQIGDLRALRPLIELLKQNKPSAHAVCVALCRFGEHAVEPLIQVLLDPDAHRAHDLVLRTLWLLGDERAVEPILKVLKSTDDPLIRYSAVLALGHLEAQQAVDPLFQTLYETTDSNLRQGAAKALARIGNKHALDVLANALEYGTADVQHVAAQALGKDAALVSGKIERGEYNQRALGAGEQPDPHMRSAAELAPDNLRDGRRAMDAPRTAFGDLHMDAHSPSPSVRQPTAISVVSGSQLFNDGLTSLLQDHLPIELVGTYLGDLEVSDGLPNPPGHIVLLDSGVGLERVIALTRKWCGLTPPPWIIVLELPEDVDTILRCIEVGARGYTLKGSSVAEIAAIIRRGQRGDAWCSPGMIAHLFERLARLSASQTTMAHLTTLTRREMEVLRCIGKGRSNKEIARELVIEVRTVKHHVHNILEKLQVQHRWDAARVAKRQGWLEEEEVSV